MIIIKDECDLSHTLFCLATQELVDSTDFLLRQTFGTLLPSSIALSIMTPLQRERTVVTYLKRKRGVFE